MKLSLLALLLAAVTVASAESTENLLAQLQTAARAEAKEARESTDQVHLQRALQWQELLTQLDRQTGGEGSATELLRTVQSMEAAASSEKLATLCHTLAKQLRDEQEKRDTALADEMEKSFTQVLKAALEAKSMKDLDEPLATVHNYIQRPRMETYTNVKLQKLYGQGQQLWQFLRQWQDYLAGVDTDGSSTPKQRLQRLLSSGSDFSNLVPRSEILERLNGNKPAEQKKWTPEEMDQKAREILMSTHTLDDVSKSIRQFEELSAQEHSGFYSQITQNSLQHLNNIDRLRRELDNGLSTTASLQTLAPSSNAEIDRILVPIHEQLLLYALPRLLNVGEADKPRADETAPSYLQRMITTAQERANWSTLERALDLAQSLKIKPEPNLNDRNALHSFLVGLNQERAKQYAFAVVSYENALKQGSQIVSAELVGEHLEGIRKEHPDEYAQGIQAAMSPPPAADPRIIPLRQ